MTALGQRDPVADGDLKGISLCWGREQTWCGEAYTGTVVVEGGNGTVDDELVVEVVFGVETLLVVLVVGGRIVVVGFVLVLVRVAVTVTVTTSGADVLFVVGGGGGELVVVDLVEVEDLVAVTVIVTTGGVGVLVLIVTV